MGRGETQSLARPERIVRDPRCESLPAKPLQPHCYGCNASLAQGSRPPWLVFQTGQELKEFSKKVFKNDLAVRNGDDSYELPVPATFVIDRTGVVRFAHVDVDYMTGRAEPEAVVAALEAIAHPVAR